MKQSWFITWCDFHGSYTSKTLYCHQRKAIAIKFKSEDQMMGVRWELKSQLLSTNFRQASWLVDKKGTCRFNKTMGSFRVLPNHRYINFECLLLAFSKLFWLLLFPVPANNWSQKNIIIAFFLFFFFFGHILVITLLYCSTKREKDSTAYFYCTSSFMSATRFSSVLCSWL